MPRISSDVWAFFEIDMVDEKKIGKCNFCQSVFKTPNATKMKEHILRCREAPADIKNKFKVHFPLTSTPDTRRPLTPHRRHNPEDDNVMANQTAPATSLVSVSHDMSQSSHASIPSPSEHKPIIHNSDEKELQESLDTAIARAIYASGNALSMLESRYWQEVFKIATCMNNPNYQTPSRDAISSSLLEAEYTRVQEKIEQKIASSEGLGLVSNGWIINGKAVLNFLLTTPDPIFFKSVLPGTRRETGEFIAGELKTIIEEVGSARFVCVITDNASNMKAAWREIESTYANISCVGCAAHTFNLLINDLTKIDLFNETIKGYKETVRYITKNTNVLAHFVARQKDMYGKRANTLKLYAKTRWAGVVLCLESFLQNRQALEMVAISQELKISPQIKEVILGEHTWQKVQFCVKVLSSTVKAIAKAEANSSVLSDVPHLFTVIKNKMESEIKSEYTREIITPLDEIDITQYINQRREFVLKPIHLAANLLDPRFLGKDLTNNEFGLATKYISKMATYLNQDMVQVMKNLAEYRTKTGFWCRNEIWLPVDNLEPRIWWQGLCDGHAITKIAIKILSIPPSSAASERNWSLFNRTHTKSRNPLTDDRVKKLVTISANLKLMDDITESDKEDEIDDEETESDEDNKDEEDSIPSPHFDDVGFVNVTNHLD